ncbi:MAG: efflux RND transporter periplasmic adaptor subunit [Phycisphaerae bacterium]|nr:efflux RND transporter periplasmic adaptor subunit [Phycisphaerae bacterium]
MTRNPQRRAVPRWLRPVVAGAAFTVVGVLLMLWLAGVFRPKVDASVSSAPPPRPIGSRSVVEVRTVRVPNIESAVGTIRAVHEAAVASKLLARVVEVSVQAGQVVQKDDILVRLDDADLKARLQQAQAAVAAATAARDQAQVEFDRIQKLKELNQSAPIEFDRVQSALKAAEADLIRAEQARTEAETILAYATIRSPIDGTVVDKRVEAGDTAQPGQVLLNLYDPTRMQLVARVRETLTQRLAVGQDIEVRIEALDKQCTGRISEIVPEAQTASRSFSVKVTGPCPPGIYSGMFGRLLIPLDEQDVLVVPKNAVRRVGQLDLVDVVDPKANALRRRIVQLGGPVNGDIQVLAGLRAGEKVALPG